jgi:MerR family transcriptional regulator, repressor of the yfmOP operon
MTAPAAARQYRIGEAAERAGTTTRTIRYYEELGLLGAGSGRDKGAQRLYTESDVSRLEELIRLRDLLGLTLDELVEIAEAEAARAALRNQWADSATNEERLQIVDAAIPLVERQLELIEARRERLVACAGELDEKLRRLEQLRRALVRTRGS